jgi:hypothetical protein
MIIIYLGSAKTFCNCPNAEPGKIVLEVSAHQPDCRFRKRLVTKRYTIDTSVTPEQFKDGYSVGVALTN